MRKYLLIFYLLLLVGELIAVQLDNQVLQFIFKPALLPALAFYFVTFTRGGHTTARRWILGALILSWAGDVLLLFQERDALFFLLGLSSFLLAHSCYIIFFQRVRLAENIRSRMLLLLPVVIYYVVLIRILSPYLADMKLPVRIYGIVISFMLLLALHMIFIRNKTAGWLMMAGAILFVLSDSILAINKFYSPFPLAGILIMLTYGLAQLFIVMGAIRYIHPGKSL